MLVYNDIKRLRNIPKNSLVILSVHLVKNGKNGNSTFIFSFLKYKLCRVMLHKTLAHFSANKPLGKKDIVIISVS